MSDRSDLVDIDDVAYLRETDLAILFQTSGGKEVWVPKSVAEWDGDILTLPESWAQSKGLI